MIMFENTISHSGEDSHLIRSPYIPQIFSKCIQSLKVGELICFIVTLQIKLWESHWLFRRVYGFIFTAAAVYMVRMTSRKLHCDVMKTNYS